MRCGRTTRGWRVWGAGGGRWAGALHSSTFRLNISTSCWIRWVHKFPPVYYTGGHGEV